MPILTNRIREPTAEVGRMPSCPALDRHLLCWEILLLRLRNGSLFLITSYLTLICFA